MAKFAKVVSAVQPMVCAMANCLHFAVATGHSQQNITCRLNTDDKKKFRQFVTTRANTSQTLGGKHWW
jgi:hypothetical protein